MFDDFQQVEAFLQSRRQHGVKPGLKRINRLLSLVGEPQKKMVAIHVAGTNGKGSTIRFMQKALTANGYHIGVFQSPSLTGYTGHMLIDDTRIPCGTFMGYVTKLLPFIQQLDDEHNHPTEFEIITAVAFLYFADNADIALIETGMGGREDTTNCINPILSIITNVSRDHTAFLGGTLAAIAWQKAGIIKENRPVIVGEMGDDARSVIAQEAFEANASLYLSGESFRYEVVDIAASHQTFQWICDSGSRREIVLQTTGMHQVSNASLAIMALKLLEDKGFTLDWPSCINALAFVSIPGRFEQIHGLPAIILDGAHNAGGVETFTDTLQRHFADMERHLIFAAFRDKDLKTMLEGLEPHFASVTLTVFDHPRAASIQQLQQYSQHPAVQSVSDWREAVRQISFQRENTCYCITGSLHFIGIVRKYFDEIVGL
ncbi:bifunctional folylpolyglutamate synthase/dihydrofolate synthase [Lentibacillus salinarum]|uniref:tetrahydrofolate synthase n=1 Tax=Lentibacillus salinarum TaxID=446820 RepID=A0ABW3ZXL8_9BACI